MTLIHAPAGMLEDHAMRSVDRLAEMDMTNLDLTVLLAIKLRVNQIWTAACLAQHVAREAAE